MSVRPYFLFLSLHIRLDRLLTVLIFGRRSDFVVVTGRKHQQATRTLTLAAAYRATMPVTMPLYPVSPALAAALAAAAAHCEQPAVPTIPAPRTVAGWRSLSNR